MATKKSNNLKLLLISFSIISISAVSYISWKYNNTFGYLGLSDKQEIWAQFGDYMGGTLNPILAFLSFMALLYTIKIQTDELELTRNELEKSTIAQEKQSSSLSLQNKSTEIQIFENTFFQLFKQHQVLLSELIRELEGYKSGAQVLVNEISVPEFISGSYEKIMIEDKEISLEDNFIEYNERIVKRYFMTLYQILKFIDKSLVDDKKLYTNIIRANLDDKVLSLLIINCTNPKFIKYKEYLENYEFFEHLYTNKDQIDSSMAMFKLIKLLFNYKPNVFGKNTKLLQIVAKYKTKHNDW